MDNRLRDLRSQLGSRAVISSPVSAEKPHPTMSNATKWQASAPKESNYFSDGEYDDELPMTNECDPDEDPALLFSIPTEKPELLHFDLKTGELAPKDMQFVAIKDLNNYPARFVPYPKQNRLKKAYFDKGEAYERRSWDFFYIHPGVEVSKRPLILVPLSQVEAFLFTINSEHGSTLGVPTHARDPFFVIDFPSNGAPRPRYIGRSDDFATAKLLWKATPVSSYRPYGCNEDDAMSNPPLGALEAFREKMMQMTDDEKKRKAAMKAKRTAERHSKQNGWSRATKVVQRQLGLRGRENGSTPPVTTVDDLGAILEGLKVSTYADLDKPPPFPREDNVVFICVDVEAYEHNQNLITEIGIASLDTADLADVAPGRDAKNWFPLIRARHFRIKEYKHLNNRVFVKGCADKFDFGESEVIGLREAPKAIAECFREPFCKRTEVKDINAKWLDHLQATSTQGPSSNNTNALPFFTPSNAKRPLVLVGHSVGGDITYLRRLGYSVSNLSNLLSTVDTLKLYSALAHDIQGSSLGKVLADLGIPGINLHNAGNDAVLTLQAMLAISVRALTDSQIYEQRARDGASEKIKKAVVEAKDKVVGKLDGWESDGGDGGEVVKFNWRTEPK